MLVKGDVKCLSCGFVSGHWVGERGKPVLGAGFAPRGGGPGPGPDRLVRCARCEGSVYLDDPSPVQSAARLRRIARLRRQLAAFDVRAGAA